MSGVLRALARRLRRPDDGVSLPELAVTAAVGAVVLAGVATVAVGSLEASRTLSARAGESADARVASETVTRALRVAVRPRGQTAAFVSATTTSASFYALLNRSAAAQTTDTVPSFVELGWNGTCLTRRITAGVVVANPPTGGPYYTWTPSGAAQCVVRTTTAPAYSYYATPVISSGGVDTTPITPTAGAIAAGDLRSVQSVEVRVTVRDPRHSDVPATSVVTRVTLANVLTDTGGQ